MQLGSATEVDGRHCCVAENRHHAVESAASGGFGGAACRAAFLVRIGNYCAAEGHDCSVWRRMLASHGIARQRSLYL